MVCVVKPASEASAISKCVTPSSGQAVEEEGQTGQDRTGQDRTGQDRTGQDRTGQDRTGQDRTGWDRTGQDRTGQDRTGQDRTGQGRTGQDSIEWDQERGSEFELSEGGCVHSEQVESHTVAPKIMYNLKMSTTIGCQAVWL